MYHKSLAKNKSWYLVIGLWSLIFSLILVILFIAYQSQKKHFDDNQRIYRDLSFFRLRDYFNEDQKIFSRLKITSLDQGNFKSSLFSSLNNRNLFSRSIKELNQEGVFSEKIRSIFYFNINTSENLWFSREGKVLRNLSMLPIESLIKDFSYADNKLLQEKIFISSFFSYSLKKNDPPLRGVLFLKKIQEDGNLLGFYGFLIDVESWQNQINNLGKKSVIISDNLSFILGDRDLSYFLGSLKKKEIASNEFLLENSHFRILEDKVFFSYPLENFIGNYWYLVQETNLSFLDYLKDIFPSLVILLIVGFLLSFLICYIFIEKYIGRPINILSDHIIDICYEHNLFKELPEFSKKDEVGYFVTQFFYFQKRMGTMLLQIKNFHMQNSSIQEAIYNRSGNLYANSQDSLIKSSSLMKNCQILEQNMKNFIKEISSLSELFEGMSFSLKESIKSKENMMISWKDLCKFFQKISSQKPDSYISLSKESSYKIIGLYQDTEKELASLQLQVENSYKLLEKFNQNHMRFLDSFFNFKETLTFLIGLSKDSSESLNQIYREIEELFFLQSQELKKSREKIASLLEKV